MITNPVSQSRSKGTVSNLGAVYYKQSASWVLADANGAASVAYTGFMGVKVTTTAYTTGFVIKGPVQLANDPGGNVGDPCYLSTTAGRLTTTAPNGSGEAVRLMGWKIGTNLVYFSPSNDWIIRT